jgi:hypothetical protein
MLYVIQHRFNIPAENIVYCVSSVQKILDQQLDFIFTDGHALDCFSKQYSILDLENMDTILDKNALNAKYWKDDNDLDMKRRKEAEFLVLGDILIDSVLGFIVSNENAKHKIIALGANPLNVHTRQEYYF